MHSCLSFYLKCVFLAEYKVFYFLKKLKWGKPLTFIKLYNSNQCFPCRVNLHWFKSSGASWGNLKCPHTRRAGRDWKETTPDRSVAGLMSKQLTRLDLGSHKTSSSLPLAISFLKVPIESLNGLHAHSKSRWSQQHTAPSKFILENWSHCGNGDQTIPSKDRGEVRSLRFPSPAQGSASRRVLSWRSPIIIEHFLWCNLISYIAFPLGKKWDRNKQFSK